MSLKELARETGLSAGYLSRLESGEREPSWAVLRVIASVWDLEPMVHLVSPAAERQARAARLAHLAPDDRLARQNAAVFNAAILLATSVADAAITGTAAAVLQGVTVDVPVLDALVPDEDEAIEQLVLLLMRSYCLYQELSPHEFRALDRHTWVVGEADAVIRLVPELPTILPMTLDEVPVRVVALAHLLETDPVVADAAAAINPGSA